MRWAAEGMLNPMGKPLAEEAWKRGIAFPDKMAELQQKAEDARIARVQTMQGQLDRLEMQLKDRALDREQRAILQTQAESLRVAIHNDLLPIRRLQAENAGNPLRNILLQQQIDKNERGQALTKPEKEELNALQRDVTALDSMEQTFKPEYAGYGLAGAPLRAGAAALGSWAPEIAQEANQWWSQYENLVEMPTRHALFGSALTATETNAWNRAKLIKPGSDPKVVMQAVRTLRAIAAKHRDVLAKAFEAEGKNMGSVRALTGEERTVVRTGTRKDGRKVIQYSDGTQEVQ
jgi:hypothetical protein